ncbi:hypothetical protein Nepgr_002957 [Nepenthes gracilis]|uniref:Uncharacterized protein n=1 Tax=Nepenthes gracilis TaxID=150966 RepID=A0AAD3RYM0_NEPGR|nr:hypothetical protein Nepgr_002957 [Nepenthes gracilis]
MCNQRLEQACENLPFDEKVLGDQAYILIMYVLSRFLVGSQILLPNLFASLFPELLDANLHEGYIRMRVHLVGG